MHLEGYAKVETQRHTVDYLFFPQIPPLFHTPSDILTRPSVRRPLESELYARRVANATETVSHALNRLVSGGINGLRTLGFYSPYGTEDDADVFPSLASLVQAQKHLEVLTLHQFYTPLSLVRSLGTHGMLRRVNIRPPMPHETPTRDLMIALSADVLALVVARKVPL